MCTLRFVTFPEAEIENKKKLSYAITDLFYLNIQESICSVFSRFTHYSKAELKFSGGTVPASN